MGRKRTPGLYQRQGIWHIDKRVHGERLCESTGTGVLAEAEAHLARRVEQVRQAKVFGIRPQRTWREAATRHLKENLHLASIGDDAGHLRQLDPFLGDLALDQVHIGTLQPFIAKRRQAGVKTSTINRALEVVRKILNQAASEWLDGHGLTWLHAAPKIKLLPVRDARRPYALSWEEQTTLFQELPLHLLRMTLFKVNTGTREQEVCQLRWEWERWIPELQCSVFIIPAWIAGTDGIQGMVKNREDRLVVLNRIAQSVIEDVRGEHPEFVFTYQGRAKRDRGPVTCMNNTAWQRARRKTGIPVRVHDLKHTFGRRLRAAGISHETRQVLLGHTNRDITVHYSPAEIAELKDAVDSLCTATMQQVTVLQVVASVPQISRTGGSNKKAG